MHVRMYVCIYVCTCMYACMYVFMFICIYACLTYLTYVINIYYFIIIPLWERRKLQLLTKKGKMTNCWRDFRNVCRLITSMIK